MAMGSLLKVFLKRCHLKHVLKVISFEEFSLTYPVALLFKRIYAFLCQVLGILIRQVLSIVQRLLFTEVLTAELCMDSKSAQSRC